MRCVILSALAVSGTVFGADRLSTSEKGSLLIFSDIAGNSTPGASAGFAEGLMVISNDYPADVRLQSYVVNNQACEAYDMAFSLTANQVAAFYGADLSAPFGDC
ncbi:MAG: hypothetical protein AAFR78_01695, partial [Planctomycetota bacterium]